MRLHPTVWCASAQAEVDEGIVSLVDAINALPGVETLASCQEGLAGAEVHFHCEDGDTDDLFRVVRAMNDKLEPLEARGFFHLELRWPTSPVSAGGKRTPRAVLQCWPTYVTKVTEALL